MADGHERDDREDQDDPAAGAAQAAENATLFDPAPTLAQIDAATEHVLRTAARFTDADVRAPSLLPNWSRGHVLTHLARNADGGRNLLIWARTGVVTPEYPSMAARAGQIEAGAARSAAELQADVRDSAARFAEEYRRMPPEAWTRPVRWTGGKQRPAARAADSRLTEVLVHHVDLAADYTPADWPPDFVRDLLARVASAFNARDDAPAMRLHPTDTSADTYTSTDHVIGPVSAPVPAPTIHGTQASLLAWLMGRHNGADLTVHGAPELPRPLFLY